MTDQDLSFFRVRSKPKDVPSFSWLICYRCGWGFARFNEAFSDRCDCGVGWYSVKPVPGYVARLPADWHSHTVLGKSRNRRGGR